jgi:hypothetical protein
LQLVLSFAPARRYFSSARGFSRSTGFEVMTLALMGGFLSCCAIRRPPDPGRRITFNWFEELKRLVPTK